MDHKYKLIPKFKLRKIEKKTTLYFKREVVVFVIAADVTGTAL